jgi:predicted glycosyltransferase
VRVWVDIDNPPQVRYLLPLVRRFERAGHDVLLTARAYGDTFALLRSENAEFEGIGMGFGKGLPRKLYGLVRRARVLADFVGEQTTPVELVLAGSRSATVAARFLGIPSFVIIDYEYVNLLVQRLCGSYVLHPSVIDPSVFRRHGIAPDRLIPFEGLKEDISFADLDVASAPTHEFPDTGSAVRVLVRPPAEESHYYRPASRRLALQLLHYLAERGAQVVFSPRDPRQIGYLDEIPSWQEDPIVLREPLPFVSLLKAVDAVASAGGTMIREASYLGVPAYSVFRGTVGAVDRHLASIGRLTLLSAPSEFQRIALQRSPSISPLRTDATAAEEVVRIILELATESEARRDETRSAV